jgi:rhodanese-related sulfurtransferase
MGWFGGRSVSVSDAHAAVQEGGMLVDVRTSRERKLDGAPQGAAHVPLERLAEQLAMLESRSVYVICRSGNRSSRAAAQLRRSGIDAHNVKGGILAWKREGLPLESATKRPRKTQ